MERTCLWAQAMDSMGAWGLSTLLILAWPFLPPPSQLQPSSHHTVLDETPFHKRVAHLWSVW